MLVGLFAVPGADASGAFSLPAAPPADGTADSTIGVVTSGTSTDGTVAIPGVSSYRVQRFDADALRGQATRSMHASLSLAGTVMALNLEPYDLAGPDFRVTDESGQSVPVDLSSLSSYGGTLEGVAGSSLSLTFSGDWFSLWIDVDGKATIVEPLRQWDPDVGRDAYAVYTSDNARLTLGLADDEVPIPDGATVATVTDGDAVATTGYNVTADDFPSVSTTPESASAGQELALRVGANANLSGESAPLQSSTDSGVSDKGNRTRGAAEDAYFRLLRLVVTVDPQYQNAFSDWAGSVWSTVGGLNSILEPQASVHVQLQQVNVWSGSPYEFDVFRLLTDYRNYMQGVGTVRDYGILFSGKQLGGGIAYLRGLGTSWAYAVTQHVAEGSFDGSQFQRTLGVTHESGHGLNGVHEQAWCDWLNKCTIMKGPDWNGNDYFSYFSDGQDNGVKGNRQRIIRWSWANLHRVLIVADGLPDTNTADGLRLVSFTIEADDVLAVNAYVTVSYQINNVDGFMKTFPTYGFFVGARDASGANRDFGLNGGTTLCGYCGIAVVASRSLISGGTWEFWPAYYYDPPGTPGPRWGTYRWHYQTRNAYYVLGHTAVPAFSCTFDNTYNVPCDGFIDVTGPRVMNGLLFHFYLLAFRSAPRVNDYVYVISTFFWTGTDAPSLNYFFVVGRSPAWANKDFGYTGSWQPAPRPTWDTDGTTGNNPAGGAMIDQLSRVLDSSGTWWFWPSYRRDASYFDFAGSAISISVSA